tara:strand:+ start:335 stop:619 length:285 start_codon:yes stop_codon:yes gene_type:complete
MNKNIPMINKKLLRKNSYCLKPVVIIGQNGLSEAVIAEIDASLNAHELIKIRIREPNKNKRYEQCLQIQKKLGTEIIHQIGFIVSFYRPKPKST